MKHAAWIGFALAALLLFAGLNAGCGASDADAFRQMVVASGDDGIFVLDSASGRIFELKKFDRRIGGYRIVPYETGEGTAFLPMAQAGMGAAATFYGENSSGIFELSILKGEDGYTWESNGLNIGPGKTLVAAYDKEFILVAGDGASVENLDGSLVINRPEGNFASPVVARDPDGGWVVVWPEKLAEAQRKGGALAIEMTGYGKPGRFNVQAVEPGGAIGEYVLENDTFIETRARGLIGAALDEEGRLILIDDKGYLSTYDGTRMLSNVFGQIAPSRYAINTMALGPEGSVLVTDAVSRTVSMIDPISGDVACSWRLPKVRKEATGSGVGIGAIIFDIVLIVIVIILVVRIRSRLRRHTVYR